MTKIFLTHQWKEPTIAGLFVVLSALFFGMTISFVTPSKVLAQALPHAGVQPLASVYLSQIPYTGLDLGPIGTSLYWLAIIGWVVALSYFILFKAIPFTSRSFRDFGVRISETLNSEKVMTIVPLEASVAVPILARVIPHDMPRGYSSYDGFKSFARDGVLGIEDIVKGLSREHLGEKVSQDAARPALVEVKAKPIQAYVAPAVASVGHIATPVVAAPPKTNQSVEIAEAPLTVQSLVTRLIEGDRVAVFAGLREFVRGGGKPESLVHSVVCLLDDTYRARIDGVSSENAVARLTARLDTSTLENLISALTTAIDSSYSDSVTGAKLAFTRALAVLGA